eukprot:g2026.t1
MPNAVITGGNKGLGLYQTRRFIEAGYRVHVVARSRGDLNQIEEDVVFVEHDLAEKGDVGFLDKIHSETGAIDVLANNAGVHLKKPVWDVSPDELDKVLSINVHAMFAACGRFVELQRETGGAIVNIASMGAIMALPSAAAYVTAKTAVVGLTRSVAVDAAKFGIRCNAVSPGFIDTDMTRAILAKDPERRHEACARVVDANGSGLTEGALVALNPIMHCGVCDACKRGEINLCTAKKFPGSATTVPHIDGFFQETIDHPAAQCRQVSDTVNPRHLTFAEPLACALHSVNKGHVGPGDRVLVTGCGPMGLLAIAAAVSKGGKVTCIDMRPEAARLGMKVGAVEGLTVEEFQALSPSPEFDVVVEASGAIPAFNLALKQVRRKGRISILSNIQPKPASIDLHLIMLKEIEIVGSFQFNREFEEAVQVIEAGETDFDAITAAVFPLSEAYDALKLMQQGGNAGKILLLGSAAN